MNTKQLVTRGALVLAAAACIFGFTQVTPRGKFASITIQNSNTSSPAAADAVTTTVATPSSFIDIAMEDNRASYVGVTVTGTWTGSGGLIARGSTDGGHSYQAIGPYPFINANTGLVTATIASGATGTWYVPCTALQAVRIDAEGAVTGTAYVGLTVSVSAVPVTVMQTVANGVNATTVTAATGTAVKASAGQLCRVTVNTSGSAVTLIYDNASALSGTIIGAIPASPTIGTVYTFNAPAANGIYVGTTNTSGLTLYYN